MSILSKQLDFSTKAKTLASLSPVITTGNVLPVLSFTAASFNEYPDQILKKIQTEFNTGLIVVRSSSANEDGADVSNAGHYESILNVPYNDKDAIAAAIRNVIQSFGKIGQEDEVFVQPQLENISSAGVAFTSDLDTLAPYYIINYDESGSTDSVTSGTGSNLKTFVYYKNSPIVCNDKSLNKIIVCLKELEAIFNFPYLDVEFAISNSDLYIFQVRRISSKSKEDLSYITLDDALLKTHKKITKLSAPHPNLLGEHAVYGVMPDWNPAEIIGLKPKHLAASLYKEMITDSIWAYQRDNYGYRNLRSHPLMLLFHGVPYIDVRVDFNSFIPKTLDENTAAKLTDYYLSKLINSPLLHDKVEFEIVHSCFYFNLPEILRKDLLPAGFTEAEIKNIESSLLGITNAIIHPETGLYKKDILQAEKLSKKYKQIIDSKLSIVDKIYWLVEDCKRYGTLPFAGIARSAFIGTQFLRSMRDLHIISNEEYSRFTGSLNTITRELNSDLLSYSLGKLDKSDFLEKYGHLRPGTYDILSKRYDENFENYFSEPSPTLSVSEPFEFSERQLAGIDELIKKYGLGITAPQLINFIKISIEGRELLKFIFTKSLSRVLAFIEELAVKYGVKKEDLAYLDIKTVLDLYASVDYRNVKNIFEREIEKNKISYDYTRVIKLPTLITGPNDVYFHFIPTEEPNFITLKSTCSKIVPEEDVHSENLEGLIIFIKSADPGYDFLFTKNIGGLVTQFGGANSHMAVRCAELGIPAVIGAGESNYNNWSKSSLLELDCLNKTVKIIS